MTNTQFFIAVAIPTLAILLNYLFTRGEMRDLRSELRSDSSDLRSGLDVVRNEIGDVKISIANLRAELYEKFALKGETAP